MIQQQLTAETGQVVLLKDLTNLSSALRKGKSRNNLDVAVNILMDDYGKLDLQILPYWLGQGILWPPSPLPPSPLPPSPMSLLEECGLSQS